MAQECISKMSCFTPSFCLPSPETHEVISPASAGKNFRRGDESPQQLGCVRELSFYIKHHSYLARLWPFPAKILEISQVLRLVFQQAHAHLTDKSEYCPCLQGEKLAMNSRLPIRSLDLELESRAAWLPTDTHRDTQGSASTGGLQHK